MAVTNERGLAIDGMVGLGPKKSGVTMEGTKIQNLNFVEEMFNNNIINKELFSIHLGTSNSQSFITFGDHDEDQFSGKLIKFNNTDKTNNYWSQSVTLMSYGFDIIFEEEEEIGG